VDFGQAKTKASGGGEAPVKTCFGCNEIVPAQARTCECGFRFPEPEKRHDAVADEQSQILSEPVTFDVESWVFSRHFKKGEPTAPNTLRVTYFSAGDLETCIEEWVCLNHTGFAQRRALNWWSEHSDEDIMELAEALDRDPIDVALDAYGRGLVKRPKQITAVQQGRWWRIISRVTGEYEPRAVEELDIPF
jgi:DNA repair protein RadD